MRQANPYLPLVENILPSGHARVHREECGGEFYRACLELSQSKWLEGKPAQAILQLNKAFMATESDPDWPLPYQALIWFLEHRQAEEFLGNPVRHFQHLATRMSGPRRELRSLRAWGCFHLASLVLPEKDYPRDQEQIVREGVMIPSWEEILPLLPQEDRSLLAICLEEIKEVSAQRP